MLRRVACRSVFRTATAVFTLNRPVAQVRSIRTSPPTEELQRGVTSQEEEYADDADVGEHTHRGSAPKPEGPPKYITYDTDADGITTLKLNRAPVNSFNREFFEEVTHWLMWMGDAEDISAVVLSSNINAIFSAGLDFAELYEPKEDLFPKFWYSFQNFFIALNTFPKPLICAINGNSPAAGCIAALGCDYRIMAKHPKDKPDRLYRIGLNETKFGLVAPPWSMASLGYVVGKRNAEKLLQLGETPTGAEALAIGLIDELVSEEDVIPRAVAAAKKFLSVNNQARCLSRDMMRIEIMSSLGDHEAQEEDMKFFADMIIKPELQKSLAEYLARLKGGKK